MQVKHLIKNIVCCVAALLVLCILGITFLPAILIPGYCSAPENKQFDVIIVLGNPARNDGTPGSVMRERILKGVELYKAKKAPVIIFTGAAVQNKFAEASVMAQQAENSGVPAAAIIQDTVSRTTDQNAFNTAEIMKQRKMKSALVVTSPFHMKRSSYIFSHYRIEYACAPSNEPSETGFFKKNNVVRT